jgi:small-conductance mechanosensitive channel
VDINWQEIAGALDAVVNYTFSIGGQEVSVADLFVVLVILGVTWGVSRLIRRALTRLMRRRGVEDEGTIAVTTRILHYAIMAVGLLTGLDQVGINLSALFAAGAVFAVGVGFALQNLSENFVSGVILLFERSIKPGDVVEVDGTTVRVLKMGMRTTLCRNREDEEIIVPNAILVSNSVKNYTLQDSLQRLRGVVGVAYESDMKQVMQVLDEMAKGLAWQSRSRSPVVLLTEFGSSSVNFEVSVWIDDPWQAPKRRSQLMEGIWFALKDHEITIAFPQLDVHFDPPVEDAVTKLPKAS